MRVIRILHGGLVMSIFEQSDARPQSVRRARSVAAARRRRQSCEPRTAAPRQWANDDRPELRPPDLASLVVLGSVNEGYGTFTDIVAAAQSIAAPDWQPTGDVLAGAIETALERGHLRCTERADSDLDVSLAISAGGKRRLCALLRQPGPCCRRASGRVAIALKICFLGALDSKGRRQLLEELAHAHRCELSHLREGCTSCPAARAYARHWMDREIERIEQELAWLDRLQADLATV